MTTFLTGLTTPLHPSQKRSPEPSMITTSLISLFPESLFWCFVNMHESFLILMDVRMNFLLISLYAILAMWKIRWQLANWGRTDLLFLYLEILIYRDSLFKLFLRIQTILDINCAKTYHLRWEIPLSPPPCPCINVFFSRLARKQLWNWGEGAKQMLLALFAFLPLIYGKDCRDTISLK